jgi:hypothetical protein
MLARLLQDKTREEEKRTTYERIDAGKNDAAEALKESFFLASCAQIKEALN